MIDKKALVCSICINFFFLILCLFFGKLRFGAIDDWFMVGILSGIYGEGYNVHLTFVNVAYGYCLLPLYHLFPSINWYYIGEIASIFVSLSVICYILIKKTGYRWGSILAMLLVLLCASDYYLVLQFTQCAAMLSAAGMIAFIYGVCKLEESRCKKELGVVTIVVGILLLLWGSWMRWPAFLMGMPFFSCTLLLLIKKLWKVKHFVITGLVVLFIAAWGFHALDAYHYQSPEYKKYMDFQGPRSLLGDGRNYNQQAVDEDLDEMGYSGKDFAMLTEWTFYDNEVFAPESIRVITDVIARHYNKASLPSMPSLILGALSNSAQTPIFMVWLILCVFLFITNPQKSMWAWLSLLVVAVLMAYLLYLQRLVFRVESGLWLYAGVLTIPLLKERFSMPKYFPYVIVVVIGLITLFSYSTSGPQVRSPNTGEVVPVQNEEKDTADYKGLFAFMDSVSDSTVFIASMNSYMRISRQKNPPYLTEPQGSWSQLISFGYWTPYFPDVETAFRKRGVNNPIKDVVLDNVFVIDERGLVDFLERHHYEKVKVDTVRNFNGMVIYKYSLADDSLMGVEK